MGDFDQNVQEIRDLLHSVIRRGDPQKQKRIATGWGQSGKLITRAPGLNVTMQYEFPETEMRTLQIGCSLAGNNAAGNFMAQVVVNWKTNGGASIVSRRFHVRNGTSISGVCEAVDVSVTDVSTALFAAGVQYNVYIAATGMPRGDGFQNPILDAINNIVGNALAGSTAFLVPAAGFITIPIPLDAGVTALEVTVADPAGGAIADQAAQVVQLGQGINFRSYDPRDVGGFVPLAGGADSISFVNRDAANLVFSCAFAIDG